MTTNKKRWGDRRDAVWLRDLDALHVFMPYLYPNRADNEAFISETIDLENIDRYLAEKNAALPDGEEPYKLFYLLLSALVKTITLRPKMNRFIANKNFYQRNEISMSFVVKKQFADEAAEALAACNDHVKGAITMLLLGCDAAAAESALEDAHGHVRAAVEAHARA